MKRKKKQAKLPRTPEMIQERMRQSRAAGKHGKKPVRSEVERQAIELDKDL